MKKTILIVGIACASLMAAAQSDTQVQQKNIVHRDLAAREAASGQASGRSSVQTARETGSGMATGRAAVQTSRETGSGMATGKTMAQDDWQAQQKTKGGMSGANSNPMYKDSGNSGVNPLYESNARGATKSRSNVQNNRVATGDVNGDGTADGVVKSKSNITNNRVAGGDLDGDGMPDVAVSADAQAQMKGDFSRGQQPDRKAAGAPKNSNSSREVQSGLATGRRQHQ